VKKKLSKATSMLALAALASMAGASALADDSGWYIGANVGQSRTKIDDERIARSLQGGGFTTTSISDDSNDVGYKLFGGYQFMKYLAVEGGYFDLGKFGFTAQTQPPGSLTGEIKVKGVNLDAVGILPIWGKLSAFGRAGVDYADAKDTFVGTGAVSVPGNGRSKTASKRAAGFKYGAGFQYDITEAFGLRAEAERYQIDDAVGNTGDVDLFSLGVVFRFFGTAPAATRAAAHHTSAAPPRAAPVLVIVPAPETVKYCSILDIEFEIDAGDIQREEQEKLAVVGTFLKKYPDTTAVIEGHTDNVGTPEHNLALSQRRADNVVNYLADAQQVARSRLSAVGYGDTRPLADNGTQEGMRKNRRIDAVIACARDIAGLAVKPARITMALEMEFDPNQTYVDPRYRDQLSKLADFLRANPSITATVEGHTGNLQATPALAMEISELRAQTVVNYLVDNFGIARARLSSEGFGQTRRFAYNTSAEGQQENRRVNIVLNYP
jgi:OOP family OmpA-OmpF porin